jgi:RNA polymerase sigma-70 factor (ECF subfamily)
MWNKFNSFQSGTDFVAWAITIAKFKALTYINKTNRSKVQFSSEIVEILDSASSSKLNSLQEHIDTLKKCLGRLSDKERSFLRLRHEDGMTFKMMSYRIGISAPGIHRIMVAIHSKLALCVRRTLHLEEIA